MWAEKLFSNSKRKQAIDIKLATTYVRCNVYDWRVSDEENCSDHKHININTEAHESVIETYCNPRRTDWKA